MSDQSGTASLEKRLSDPPQERPSSPKAEPEDAPTKRATFFSKLNKARHKVPGVSAALPESFHKWSKHKHKQHAQQEDSLVGSDDGERSGDEEQRAGMAKDQNTDPDKPGFKVKTRYLPILSGLACPFSVLLDVSHANG